MRILIFFLSCGNWHLALPKNQWTDARRQELSSEWASQLVGTRHLKWPEIRGLDPEARPSVGRHHLFGIPTNCGSPFGTPATDAEKEARLIFLFGG